MKYLLSLFLILFLLTGCSEKEKRIRIGFNTWVGYEAVVISVKKKFFNDEDVDVKQYKTLGEVKQAFQDGEIDVMFSTTNEVLLLADKGEKIKVVLVADYSNGADNIVAQKSIHSIKDLKGKTIGVEIGSISHFLLLKALQKANLTEQDVKLVNVTDQEALVKFSDESLDAITTWSPFTANAVKAGGHVIFSSRDIPEQIVDVMSVREKIMDQYPDEILKIISAYLNTLDWLVQHNQEGIDIMAKAANMTTSDFGSALRGVELARLDENMAAFGTQQMPGTLYSSTQELIKFLLDKKVITHELNANQIIEPKFILEYLD